MAMMHREDPALLLTGETGLGQAMEDTELVLCPGSPTPWVSDQPGTSFRGGLITFC